uniref:C-type lectin domain-containing protein n=1 Tax=Monopterus albus TaxID=43700 RepID=A0A3Q3IFH6_MONAL
NMDRRQILLQLFGIAALLAGGKSIYFGFKKKKKFSKIEPGWREYQNKCYFFSTDVKSWLEANELCLEQHSNLMSIQDIQERMWVRTQIGQEIFWIGLNDRVVEGVWEWTDGSPFIETLSYPDNWGSDPGEDCGQVVGYSSGHWNDETCSAKRKYICKHSHLFYYLPNYSANPAII